MVLQIWLWESSTVPDFYLRELKYSHCLSSFFFVFFGGDGCELGWGGAACETRRFCCIVILLMPEINFGINNIPIHHHPLFCKIRTVLLRLGTVPYTWASPQCMAQKSLWKAPLFRCFASSSGFLWESSTALRERSIADRVRMRRQQNKKAGGTPGGASSPLAIKKSVYV